MFPDHTNHTAGCRGLRRFGRAAAPAFTLLEALIAMGVLGVVVLAVVSSVNTAHALSYEGQQRILAAMAADDLMLELMTLPYNELSERDGMTQPPGEMVTLDGQSYPKTFGAIGRSVSVTETELTEPGLHATLRGLRVVVTVFAETGVLAELETFVREPAP
jgi:hypothetical protein